jgi:uncharacterized protein YdaU (DUF1376 family)
MAEFPALPLWTDAYLADTRHLTTAEHGAYLLLLIEAWRRPGCSLPDDDELLARLTGLTPDAWAAAKSVVMAFWKRDGRSRTWRQKRLSAERMYVGDRSKVQRDRALKRWGKGKKADAAAVPEACRNDAPTPTPNSTLPVGKGADAPPIDPKKAVFDSGVALLCETGMKDRTARGLIAKWCKANGDAWTREAIASAAGKADPVSWIEGRKRSQEADADEAWAVSRATAERYRQMDMPGPEDWARAHGEREH